MAVLGIGIDLVDVRRMQAAIEEPGRGMRFKQRVFTANERADCDSRPSPVASYAARFAAKEAVMKALGAAGCWGFPWPEIEITRDERGVPGVVLHGRAAGKAAELGAARVHLSLAHDASIATAQAVVES